MKNESRSIKPTPNKSNTPSKVRKKPQSTDLKSKIDFYSQKKRTPAKTVRKQDCINSQGPKKKQTHVKSKPKLKIQNFLGPKYSIQLAMEQQNLYLQASLLTNWGVPHILNKNVIKVLGQGSVGVVWQVQQIKTHTKYAMKLISKAKAIAKRNIQFIMKERQILPQIQHEFMVRMVSSFQDNTHLYFILELLEGGDLRYQMNNKKKFSEQEVRFFIGCIFVSLRYLYYQNIIHRDIKPENLIFDKRGYLHLIDLGIARKLKQTEHCYGPISGTIGYIAPEVYKFQKYRYQVDYFSVGVIAYELMMGHRPFQESSVQELIKKFTIQLSDSYLISKKNIPQGWSIEAVDFINRLICINPVKRMGFISIEQLQCHYWLKNFPWDLLQRKQLDSPFIPIKTQQDYYKFGESRIQNASMLKSIEENQNLLNQGKLQDLFEGFTFYNIEKNQQNNGQSKIMASTGPSYQIRKTNQKQSKQ